LVEGLTVGRLGKVCPVGVRGELAEGGGGSLADVASPVAVVKEAFPEGDVWRTTKGLGLPDGSSTSGALGGAALAAAPGGAAVAGDVFRDASVAVDGGAVAGAFGDALVALGGGAMSVGAIALVASVAATVGLLVSSCAWIPGEAGGVRVFPRETRPAWTACCPRGGWMRVGAGPEATAAAVRRVGTSAALLSLGGDLGGMVVVSLGTRGWCLWGHAGGVSGDTRVVPQAVRW
jgi:hypothetical protein